jgi:hypothetical protein
MKRVRRQWDAMQRWLRVKRFSVAGTRTGWAAVSDRGISVLVSDSRVKVEWPLPADGWNTRRADEATLPWLQLAVMEAENDIERSSRDDAGRQ